uniref:Ion_trans_2 domain-containing protein n=1 Tax=Angiostrongylus cantonensis TaxID=6313 RepID=A0A0K0CUX3_ANGCA
MLALAALSHIQTLLPFLFLGYGNFYPRTNSGRIISMLYAFFGIPLVFTILCDELFERILCDCSINSKRMSRDFRSLQRQMEKRYQRERIRRVGSELSLRSMSTAPLLNVHRTTSNLVNTTDHQVCYLSSTSKQLVLKLLQLLYEFNLFHPKLNTVN